jgi:predicted RNase H-like HicB family nuclease
MKGRDMHYSMEIKWEPQGQVYVVTVPELPGCITHGKTYEEAIAQAQDAIDGWIAIAQHHGEVLPNPGIYDVQEVPASS